MGNSRKAPANPEHPFAPYIRILGKGKTGSRSLTRGEARDAFGMILSGAAEPLQLGAFLMLLRVKEETADELTGFVQASRDNLQPPPAELRADLDWSSYAGKKHQHPWFILSILLLAEAGHRVFIHGHLGQTSDRLYTETAMRELGLPVANNWGDVATQLDNEQLSYLPLEHFCSALQDLMELRPLLGLRSPVNTLARLLNPLQAPASLQSVFHPAYAELHQQASRLLQQPHALVFKGESGEVEVKPHADTRARLHRGEQVEELSLPRTLSGRAESVLSPGVEALRALWQGSEINAYGLQATLATSAVALLLLQPELNLATANKEVAELWKNRNTERLV